MQTTLEQPIRNQASVARQVGISRQGLQGWISRYVKEPLRRRGIEPPQSVSVQQLWSICVARAAVCAGCSAETGERIFRHLSGLQPAAIEASFAAGRSCLLILNDNFVPTLFHPQAIASGEIKALQRELEMENVELRILRLNVEPMLQQIQASQREF